MDPFLRFRSLLTPKFLTEGTPGDGVNMRSDSNAGPVIKQQILLDATPYPGQWRVTVLVHADRTRTGPEIPPRPLFFRGKICRV